MHTYSQNNSQQLIILFDYIKTNKLSLDNKKSNFDAIM